MVALKYLYNSQNIIGFLNKIKVDEHLNIYGISKNPDTEDYVMVFPCIYCKKCNDLYKNRFDANYEWCKSCQTNGLRQNFTNWTSENEEIDSLIQEIQLEINKVNDIIFEWIPYNQFNNIKEISEEGNDKIYSTIWKDGPLHYDKIRNEFTRNKQNTMVTLKSYDSQNIVDEFLIEIKEDINKYRGKIYGISQNIYTKDYIIVLQNEYSEICEKCGDITDYACGNEKIDDFIQEMQLEINDLYDTMLEFIPHNQFNNIKEINNNNLATIYSAIWEDGPLLYSEKKWTRESNKKVSLKLYYLQNTDEFLNEVEKYLSDDDNRVYGISQIQDIKYYIIVFKYKLCCERCAIWKNDFLYYDDLYSKENVRRLKLKVTLKYSQNITDEVEEYSIAIWNKGPLSYNKYEYIRTPKQIALKQLYGSQNITIGFLNEIKGYSINESDRILSIYGISQNPDTNNYIMVLDYAEGGSLYNWINKHYKNLNWSHNIEILICIIKGLEEIHERQMVHRDFHTGNILSMYAFLEDYSSMCIADMGLCERVDNTDEENIYGVMPYVAPEVLRGRPYTQAADIYSFGMIMYFIATSRQPFSYCAHDENLALDICEGIRPKMNELEVPECYVDLMKKCWNLNPDNRPKATEIAESIHLFHESYVPNSHLLTEEKNQQHYDIEKQFKKAEEYKESNTILLEERRQSPTHPQAVYTSQLLNSYTNDLPKYSECLECEI
ncbi:kinase-like domain-containing protein [Rhizophagus irregularis DAOM 181602=DAOM 197198]|nr:kinase-like domain-containing protein [Rhizophagus irregularis DAOM 181602=DAOM 197198]